jgi:pilus assembly protein CpaB
MRRHRTVLVAAGIVAIALLLSVALPQRTVVSSAPLPTPARPVSQIVVAARAIPSGATISATDLRLREVSGTASPGAILSAADAIGHVSAKAFAPGEMLSQDALRDGTAVGIAARVPSGRRAFSIRVSEDDIVGGFLQSGDHVDIFATIPGSAFPTRDSQNLADRSQTVLLLQNLSVLAVGENPATRGSIQAGARTVSLSLAPAELARLALALRFGKVSLAIRKPGDDAVSGATTATLADLVRLPEPPAPPPRPDAVVQRPSGIPLLLGVHSTFAAGGREQ